MSRFIQLRSFDGGGFSPLGLRLRGGERKVIDQDSMIVPFSLTKLETSFFLIVGPSLPFSKNIYFGQVANYFSTSPHLSEPQFSLSCWVLKSIK